MKDKAKSSNTEKDDTTPKQAPVATKKAVAKKTLNRKMGAGLGWLAIILVIAATAAGFCLLSISLNSKSVALF